jgi:hypothetical protein
MYIHKTVIKIKVIIFVQFKKHLSKEWVLSVVTKSEKNRRQYIYAPNKWVYLIVKNTFNEIKHILIKNNIFSAKK